MPAAEPKTVRTKGVRGIMLGRRPARKRHAGSDSNVVRTSDAGFTLLELLVVLVILALLAGLVGPQLFGRVDSAKVKTAETQVRMLRGALQTFRLDIGRYPTNEEGLAALVRPAATVGERWKGPYLDGELPEDPWDAPYRYNYPADNLHGFALYSLGADSQEGGEGTDADIGYLGTEKRSP